MNLIETIEQAEQRGIAAGILDQPTANPYEPGSENAEVFDRWLHKTNRAVGIGIRRVVLAGAGFMYLKQVKPAAANLVLADAIQKGMEIMIFMRAGILMSYRGEIPNWQDEQWKELKLAIMAGLCGEDFPEFNSPIERHPLPRLVYEVSADFVEEMNGGEPFNIKAGQSAVFGSKITFQRALDWLGELPDDDGLNS